MARGHDVDDSHLYCFCEPSFDASKIMIGYRLNGQDRAERLGQSMLYETVLT